MKVLVVKFAILFGFFVAWGVVHADTFSPATVAPGGSVTLSGQAKPNSSMSGYFSCSNRCGQTHIGVATVNAQGQYSLTFNIPAKANPGGAYVQIGCDRCGNGWRTVSGLQVGAVAAPLGNGLSPEKIQQVAQVGVRLSTMGRNILSTRDQVIRSAGANNAQQVNSILGVQEVQTISNNLITIGDQLSGGGRGVQSLDGVQRIAHEQELNRLIGLSNGIQAKIGQLDSAIAEKLRLIDAIKPEKDKASELQKFWEADMQQHQRNSDDAERRCNATQNPIAKDWGACGYWPQEAAAIEASKSKMGLASARVATYDAQILQIQMSAWPEQLARGFWASINDPIQENIKVIQGKLRS